MREEQAQDENQDAGLRRSARREQQRQKARMGMRVSARPDSLHPVTVERVAQLTQTASRKKNARSGR
jgi:hypothetical protein